MIISAIDRELKQLNQCLEASAPALWRRGLRVRSPSSPNITLLCFPMTIGSVLVGQIEDFGSNPRYRLVVEGIDGRESWPVDNPAEAFKSLQEELAW